MLPDSSLEYIFIPISAVLIKQTAAGGSVANQSVNIHVAERSLITGFQFKLRDYESLRGKNRGFR
jgi:hypothetical protein